MNVSNEINTQMAGCVFVAECKYDVFIYTECESKVKVCVFPLGYRGRVSSLVGNFNLRRACL